MYKYFPHTESDIAEMLERIGVSSLDDLYAEIPESIRFDKDYNLHKSMSEDEVRSYFKELGNLNRPLISFAGGGAYDHYSPSVIAQLIARSEYLTAYTPYQPEISQGTLQYIFEFQSMICELIGMECCNASMYDGATATAEAMLMAIAHAKKRNKVIISRTVSERVIAVVETYARFHGVVLDYIPEKEGVTDKAAMEQMLAADDVAGVIVSTPNRYGIIEDFTGFAESTHAHKTLFIVNADPSTMAVLKTPGEWGADIACGDGQSLGMPLNFGGPYVGYLAATRDLVRKLPGRIVGATKDVDGKRAFVLTLQAREQHIRRQKANSNICSNQSLMALYVTIYMALMGKRGLQEVNEKSYAGAHYLCDKLLATGKFSLCFDKPFLKEFAVRTTLNREKLMKHLEEKGFLAGIPVEGTDDALLFCVTEKRTREEIDNLVSLIEQEG
ncbi:aminomethyl-transferring glycine dehydrogenase subunit GcvPA [Barnesiella viscericola]|uniref:aminomethyl-transferring glycine dehydrogenase subunit GcvPA n=1 Tax=Barnesiella viscericola TaxID=397865 RepID=UPI00255BDB0F|nr:aminomethyl-transferring glycine dehydrogenase subunit GcvPA [Barnesiella viscericola]